jgi:diguanylate cyclase (GGDEF)-like protein
MNERRRIKRARTFRGGKILFNSKRSVIDCTVRNLSDGGACLQVTSMSGVPDAFTLVLDGDGHTLPCQAIWKSEDRIGVSFARLGRAAPPADSSPPHGHEEHGSGDLVRGELLQLRVALDEVKVGIVLLDAELRAQFINRAYRKMWRLPDNKADNAPPFIALMYHGRDTRAYDVSEDELDDYIAERVAHVKSGSPRALDLRLANGEIIRFQCTVLPNGGRMLNYTYVTDIVVHSDELEVLCAALDNITQGIVLLDPQLNARFINAAARQLWSVTEEQAARHPPYSELVNTTRYANMYDVPADQMDRFIAARIALVRLGDPTPVDIRTRDGKTIRSCCAALPNGGRMLTYTDATDLVRTAENLERLATIDTLSGAYNRRHFLVLGEAEWSRFQRYHRSLSLMIFDIDNFKSINDRYGHQVGDAAIAHVCDLCRDTKRSSDIIARIGGDEFAVLLPETELPQAAILADRLNEALQEHPLVLDGAPVALTVSTGLAQAKLSQSGVGALMRMADQALYQAKANGREQIQCAIDPPIITEFKAAAE